MAEPAQVREVKQVLDALCGVRGQRARLGAGHKPVLHGQGALRDLQQYVQALPRARHVGDDDLGAVHFVRQELPRRHVLVDAGALDCREPVGGVKVVLPHQHRRLGRLRHRRHVLVKHHRRRAVGGETQHAVHDRHRRRRRRLQRQLGDGQRQQHRTQALLCRQQHVGRHKRRGGARRAVASKVHPKFVQRHQLRVVDFAHFVVVHFREFLSFVHGLQEGGKGEEEVHIAEHTGVSTAAKAHRKQTHAPETWLYRPSSCGG